MNLVLVESPAKAQTIEGYLGKDYKVLATFGHVKDLPKKDLSVDVENDFKPNYLRVRARRATQAVSKIKKAFEKCDTLYLATDLDREGEAIAQHIAEILKAEDAHRIVFSEITKSAIKKAVDSPGKINLNLVEAQKARRVLDRLAGYKLSQFLWEKIRYGLSAGRVQSVALKIIVDREKEIEAFKPKEYWEISADLKKDQKGESFVANLNVKKLEIKGKKEAKQVEKDLKGKDWVIREVEKKERKAHPYPPMTTAMLQRSANSYLGYSSKKTMGIAQRLYQGVNVKGLGRKALITYMRTDSTNLSEDAIKKIRGVIKKSYSQRHLPDKPKRYKTKSKVAQEAHEAIRPTHFNIPPEKIKGKVDSSMYRLYKLIWDRTIASQMTPAVYESTKVYISCGKHEFVAKGRQIKFKGFWDVSGTPKLEQNLPKNLAKGDNLLLQKLHLDQKFTNPPPRYSEAALVKVLEKNGIGRPSTYASIISVIIDRGYVNKIQKQLKPTDTGIVVSDLLSNHFEDIVDFEFTAGMEDRLDAIANGEDKYVPVIRDFWGPFIKNLEKQKKLVKKEDVTVLGKSDEKCDKCGAEMVVKLGRYGKFLSCSKFPECKGMKPILEESEEEMEKYKDPEKCPKCGGEMQLKVGKYGKFWACKKYPDCKGTSPMLLKEKCPKCGSNLVERRGRWGKTFTGCSGYPNCKYIKKG